MSVGRKGRPSGKVKKVLKTYSLSPEVVNHFKEKAEETGRSESSLVNEELLKVVRNGRGKDIRQDTPARLKTVPVNVPACEKVNDVTGVAKSALDDILGGRK